MILSIPVSNFYGWCKSKHICAWLFLLFGIPLVLRFCNALSVCHLPYICPSVPLCIRYTRNYMLDKYTRGGSSLCQNKKL